MKFSQQRISLEIFSKVGAGVLAEIPNQVFREKQGWGEVRGSRKNENGEQCKVLVIKPFSFKELD